jgi:hypothetical protein
MSSQDGRFPPSLVRQGGEEGDRAFKGFV